MWSTHSTMNRGEVIVRRSSFFLMRISFFWFGLSFLWGGLNIQLLPTRIPELVNHDVKGIAIGAVVFVGLLVAIIVQPVAGAVSDHAHTRWGKRRPFMAAGMGALIPLLLFVAYAPNYGLLFVAMVLVQVAANVAHGPFQGVIPDQVPDQQRGRASGVFGLANLLGTLAGAGIAGVWLSMAEENPDTNPFFLAGILSIMAMLAVTSILSWLCVREEAPGANPPAFMGIGHEFRRRLLELHHGPAYIWLMLSRLLFFMGLQAMDNFMQLFLKGSRENGGLIEADPELKTTVTLGAVLLMAVVTSVPAGWIADRHGKLRVIAVAAGLGLASAAMLILAQSYWQVVVFAAVLGIGVGLFTAADWAATMDLIPDKRSPGLYMGLSNVATAGGDGLATLSAGIALDVFGFRAVFGMMAVFFAASLGILPVVRSRLARANSMP